MPSFWTLKVPNIGDIQFKTFTGGTPGKSMYIRTPYVAAEFLCPVHKIPIKGHTKYFCPQCNRDYFMKDMVRRIAGQEVSPATQAPRTTEASVMIIIKQSAISGARYDTNMGYFLVPIDTYDNVIKYNVFVDLLKDTNGIAIMSRMRLRVGAQETYVFGIMPDDVRESLIMVRFRPTPQISTVPPEAKFREAYVTPKHEEQQKATIKELWKEEDGKYIE